MFLASGPGGQPAAVAALAPAPASTLPAAPVPGRQPGLPAADAIPPGAREAVEACDRLASSPNDHMRPAGFPGVDPDKLDARRAVDACRQALTMAPETPRLLFQLARAYDALKNFPEANRLFEKAAGLAYNHQYGKGVGKSPVEAIRHYDKAAERGDTTSMHNVGVAHHLGQGARKDVAEARRWYERSAGLGGASSARSLGLIYARGEGVPRDASQARRWLEQVVALGHKEARRDLAGLR